MKSSVNKIVEGYTAALTSTILQKLLQQNFPTYSTSAFSTLFYSSKILIVGSLIVKIQEQNVINNNVKNIIILVLFL